MSATGIGAAVRRKEDFRFITGQGQYTDDVVRPGETRAVFVRSPHARAKIKSIDASAAKKMPGVVDVLTGADLATDKIGNLICGWMIHSKDGTPMKMAPHPALAAGKVNHVGDAVAVVIARDAGAGARRRREGESRLRGAAGGGRSGQGEVGPADPRGGAEEHDLRMAPRRREGDGRGLRRRQARHQARHRQQPPGAERDRAARGARRIRRRHRQPHALEHLAEPARGAPGHRRLRRHGAGAQIARDRARRRRRFRLQDFHLSGRSRLPVGRAQGAPAGEMDGGPLGILPHRRARPRPRHPCRAGARCATAKSWRCAPRPSPISAPICRPSRRRCRPISTARCCRANTTSRQIYCEVDAVYTNTVPVDAYRGAGRPEATFVVERLVEVAARADGHRARRIAQAQLHQVVPAPDAGDHGLRRRRLSSPRSRRRWSSPT